MRIPQIINNLQMEDFKKLPDSIILDMLDKYVKEYIKAIKEDATEKELTEIENYIEIYLAEIKYKRKNRA